MGQVSSSAAWWPAEGLATAQAWDALVSRVSQIANEGSQAEILDWIGRSDIPGSPAERYKMVVDDLNSKYSPSTSEDITQLKSRLDTLKSYKSQLEATVKNAEQSYGTLSAPAGASSTPERDMMMECVTGGIALIGLVILPLILD
jgi:hypothetical protein